MIVNLKDMVYKKLENAGRKHDTRFQGWVKFVDSVDPAQVGGFCFKGDFVKDGTVEFSATRPRVLLATTVMGARANHTTTYSVLTAQVVEDSLRLEVVDLFTTDSTNGWALRIREGVSSLLASILDMEPVAAADPYQNDKVLLRGMAAHMLLAVCAIRGIDPEAFVLEFLSGLEA